MILHTTFQQLFFIYCRSPRAIALKSLRLGLAPVWEESYQVWTIALLEKRTWTTGMMILIRWWRNKLIGLFFEPHVLLKYEYKEQRELLSYYLWVYIIIIVLVFCFIVFFFRDCGRLCYHGYSPKPFLCSWMCRMSA